MSTWTQMVTVSIATVTEQSAKMKPSAIYVNGNLAHGVNTSNVLLYPLPLGSLTSVKMQ